MALVVFERVVEICFGVPGVQRLLLVWFALSNCPAQVAASWRKFVGV